MYHENENIFLFQLQPLINSIYFHLHNTYKQHSKEDKYKNIQTILSAAYYKWLRLLFTSFESEQRLNLLGYPFHIYLQDISFKFILLLQSKKNDLDEAVWKKLVRNWYHLPNLLFIKDQKEHYEKIYENFDSILKNNNIDKKDML